ncbi:DUF6517 family protein [Natrarchaeobius chitinivorans]|uniref:Uncharacterized protein n=1 Tax=Natrarchaeobius chitinivorans TaxID=1679083 RepID=A0A3N6M500_NATCH|nr:DUF6517 family protein [Natrarchaeobius chitinivorans]RQG91080.1 hypothetical protein EA473_19130 [Natrarchaeobius chitinivorans]
MTITRRAFLATGAAAGTATLAGCMDPLRETLSSSPATVSADARSEAGYDEHVVDEMVVDHPVGAFGLERTIEVVNWYAEYDRAISLEGLGLTRLQAAVFTVLSTPQVSVLGRTHNPIGEYSTDELVELIQERYDRLAVEEAVDEQAVTVLGTETPVTQYRGQARLVEIGRRLDVTLHVSEPVAHGEDFVLCVAVSPRLFDVDVESSSVRTLLEGIEHE